MPGTGPIPRSGANPIDASDRSFSDQEVALILRRATQMQDTSGEEHREPGLSLQVVREIAAEIGVEAHLVDRAAASLSRSSPSRVAALVGGPIKERLVDTHAHKLSESEIRELVDRIRGVMHRQGQVTDAIGSVQWQAESLETVALTISPEEEEHLASAPSDLEREADGSPS